MTVGVHGHGAPHMVVRTAQVWIPRAVISAADLLVFADGSALRSKIRRQSTIIGVSMGHGYWCQREDFPLAKTARYFLSARRFEQVARILKRLDTPEFRAFAPRAKSIATGFRTTAEASAGGSRHPSLGTS